MKKVLTVGVFDYFHYGHYKLFERAKALGDYLIVAVQDSDYIKKYKPEANLFYSTNQRLDLVGALKFVDETIVYYDVDVSIKNIDFDIFAIGEDQIHDGFKRAVEWCKTNNKQVVRLERTPNISSSKIKNQISNE